MNIVFDRQNLEQELNTRAKAMAARAIAEIVDFANNRVLARAMESFPIVMRNELEQLLDRIEDQLSAYVPVTAVKKQTEFTVQLDSFVPANKLRMIVVVREITGLGLKEAKDLVEAAPKLVIENVSKADAEKFKKHLEDAGGTVSLQ